MSPTTVAPRTARSSGAASSSPTVGAARASASRRRCRWPPGRRSRRARATSRRETPTPRCCRDLGPALARVAAAPRRAAPLRRSRADPASSSSSRARASTPTDSALRRARRRRAARSTASSACSLARLRPGDRVAVEDPGFGGVLHLVRALGLTAPAGRRRRRGSAPRRARPAPSRGAHPRFVLTPRAQNPTGAALSAARARELRRVLRARPELLVIEDDHAGRGRRRAGAERRRAARRATTRSCARSRRASGPTSALAARRGRRGDRSRASRAASSSGSRWVSHVLQRTVVELWRDPAVARRLRRAAATYTERRQALRDALAARGIAAHGATGLSVWVPVPAEARRPPGAPRRGLRRRARRALPPPVAARGAHHDRGARPRRRAARRRRVAACLAPGRGRKPSPST